MHLMTTKVRFSTLKLQLPTSGCGRSVNPNKPLVIAKKSGSLYLSFHTLFFLSQRLINMDIYDDELYAKVEDLNV